MNENKGYHWNLEVRMNKLLSVASRRATRPFSPVLLKFSDLAPWSQKKALQSPEVCPMVSIQGLKSGRKGSSPPEVQLQGLLRVALVSFAFQDLLKKQESGVPCSEAISRRRVISELTPCNPRQGLPEEHSKQIIWIHTCMHILLLTASNTWYAKQGFNTRSPRNALIRVHCSLQTFLLSRRSQLWCDARLVSRLLTKQQHTEQTPPNTRLLPPPKTKVWRCSRFRQDAHRQIRTLFYSFLCCSHIQAPRHGRFLAGPEGFESQE